MMRYWLQASLILDFVWVGLTILGILRRGTRMVRQATICLSDRSILKIEDEKMHFELLLRSFKDPRYTKINGKPFFLIYDPVSVPKEYLDNFRKWTKEAGFPDLYLVGEITKSNYIKPMLREKGFDAVVYQCDSTILAMTHCLEKWVR